MSRTETVFWTETASTESIVSSLARRGSLARETARLWLFARARSRAL
jgi:hypothetical protein